MGTKTRRASDGPHQSSELVVLHCLPFNLRRSTMSSLAVVGTKGTEEDAPESFLCPITQELMRDPVNTQDGHTYERSALEEWFRTGQNTSPLTGLPLPDTRMTPNIALRNAITEWEEKLSAILGRGRMAQVSPAPANVSEPTGNFAHLGGGRSNTRKTAPLVDRPSPRKQQWPEYTCFLCGDQFPTATPFLGTQPTCVPCRVHGPSNNPSDGTIQRPANGWPEYRCGCGALFPTKTPYYGNAPSCIACRKS